MTAQFDSKQAGSARPKGPRVFLDYDQEELDAAYDQSVYAKNSQQIMSRYKTNSMLARMRLGEPRVESYGPRAIETLDFYGCGRADAPTFIFIHGGAWRSGAAKDYAFLADTFLSAGANYAVVDFDCVQDAGGSLMVLADQVRRAIAWVYRNADKLGCMADRLYLGGHSSGAHLSSVALVHDWEKSFGLPQTLIKGALLSSGMYDLRSVRLSARSSYVKFDDETEHALSAMRHLDKLSAPVVVAYGTCETPEFQRHARDFYAALQAAGKPSRLVVAEHYNHFEMSETLANPFGLLGRAVLELMNLSPVTTPPRLALR